MNQVLTNLVKTLRALKYKAGKYKEKKVSLVRREFSLVLYRRILEWEQISNQAKNARKIGLNKSIMIYKKMLAAVFISITVTNVNAEPLPTENEGANRKPAVSTDDIINILIQQNLIDEKQLDEIINKARRQSQDDFGGAIETTEGNKKEKPAPMEENVVRVPYVPQYILEDIREKVRIELREEVVGDVMSQAEKQRWGVPGTTPHWTHKIKWNGDIRLRAETTLFDDKNNNIFSRVAYKDFNSINCY